MPHTNSWDETAPADGDLLGQGDNEIRRDKLDTRERLQEGGVIMQVSTTVDGRHAVTNGGNHPTSFILYQSDQTTPLLTPTDTTLTLAAAATYIGGNVTTGDDPGHRHTGSLALRVAGNLSTGTINISLRAPVALAFTRCSITVFTPPDGATLRISGVVHTPAPAATADPAAGGTAIWLVQANKPTIPVGGATYRNATTTFDNVTSMAVNEEIVFAIDNTGAWTTTPADLTIQMDVLAG